NRVPVVGHVRGEPRNCAARDLHHEKVTVAGLGIGSGVSQAAAIRGDPGLKVIAARTELAGLASVSLVPDQRRISSSGGLDGGEAAIIRDTEEGGDACRLVCNSVEGRKRFSENFLALCRETPGHERA